MKKDKNKIGTKKRNVRSKKQKKINLGVPILQILVILVIGLVYYLNLYFTPEEIIEYSGYAISGEEITENLLSKQETEEKIETIKIEEQERIYKKLSTYYIGEEKKEKINLEYPIYINENIALYNMNEESKLITDEYEEVEGYKNTTISGGRLYNAKDLTRADLNEYIFIKNENKIFINLREMEIQTSIGEKEKIKVNSIIYFGEGYINVYEMEGEYLKYKRIRNVDNDSKIIFIKAEGEETEEEGDNSTEGEIRTEETTYGEMREKLGISSSKRVADVKEEEPEEVVVEENEIKVEEQAEEEKINDNNIIEEEIEENNKENENKTWVEPEVSYTNFEVETYTINSKIEIKDPTREITKGVTFTIRKGDRTVAKRVLRSSGELEITGLEPGTEYKIIGEYKYTNEQGNELEKRICEETVVTKGIGELGQIELRYEIGKIYSNKIEIKDMEILNEIDSQEMKGIKRIEIEVDGEIYKLGTESIRNLIKGEKITYTTPETVESNKKVKYEIRIYDTSENLLKVTNSTGEIKTAKQSPTVRVQVTDQDVTKVEMNVILSNKDKVEIENYRYEILENGVKVKEGQISEKINKEESTEKITITDLDPSRYFTIKVYGNYDIENNEGKIENNQMGEANFTSLSMSQLGSYVINTTLVDVTQTNAKVKIQLNNSTDERLIQILHELKLEIYEYRDYGTGEEINAKEPSKTYMFSEEEIDKIKRFEEIELNLEELTSGRIYTVRITAKAKQGETIEEINTRYTLTTIATLKQSAELQIDGMFVTSEMINFDIKIKDPNNSILQKQYTLRIRDNEGRLVYTERIETNGEYKRIEVRGLEQNTTYIIEAMADEYNEGNTNATYKNNYLIPTKDGQTQIEVFTEDGISGSIGLVGLEGKPTGKNLINPMSNNKWYVNCYSDYYGVNVNKEYDVEKEILSLEVTNDTYGDDKCESVYLYDLRQYIGQVVTMSFKAKVSEAQYEIRVVDKNRNNVNINSDIGKQINSEQWKDFILTFEVNETGYVGFYIDTCEDEIGWSYDDYLGYLYLKELQIELGEEKTPYEKFDSILETTVQINLTDKRREINPNAYTIKIYEGDTLKQNYTYFNEINDNNEVKDIIKTYGEETGIEQGKEYRIDLVVMVNGKEYVIDSVNFNTNEGELKGIRNVEEFIEIMPWGNYIMLTDISMTDIDKVLDSSLWYNPSFVGKINFNGHRLIINSEMGARVPFYYMNDTAVLENIVVDVYSSDTVQYSGMVCSSNSGTIRNLQYNIKEKTDYLSGVCYYNYGTIENFVIKTEDIVSRSGLVSTNNRGIIKNGYVYGCNIEQSISGTNSSKNGVLVNENYGTIKKIFSLVNINLQESEANTVDEYEDLIKNKTIGNVLGYGYDNSVVENVYSIGNGEITNKYGEEIELSDTSSYFTKGPTVGAISTKVEIKDIYYMTENKFKNEYNKKTSLASLYDFDFQNKILNDENAFKTDELIEQGYYPQIRMSDCMPAQEYIPLPELINEDVDLLSYEVLELGADNFTARFDIYNPAKEEVKDIIIEYLDVKIISSEYDEKSKKSIITAEVSVTKENPRYLSSYAIRGIIAEKGYGVQYTKTFEPGEHILYVELCRSISNVEEWKLLNDYPTDNFRLINDLDFTGQGNSIRITKTFSGLLDGDGYKVENLNVQAGNIFSDFRRKNKKYKI